MLVGERLVFSGFFTFVTTEVATMQTIRLSCVVGRPGSVRLALLVLLALLAAFAVLWRMSPRHTIWINAEILTMSDTQPLARAISWRRGRIERVGSNDEVLDGRHWYTTVRDMQGQTVLPGFVDAHSHFPSNGVAQITTSLAPPPLGIINSLDRLYGRLSSAVSHDPDEWLLGFNYDNASLQEGTHPTREELDRISDKQPIYAYHSSGHMGVANTRALELLGSNAAEFPDGLLQESNAPKLASLLKTQGFRNLWRMFTGARDEYISNGVTTANNGATPGNLQRFLRVMAGTPLLPLRIVVNPLEVTASGPHSSAGADRAATKPHGDKPDSGDRFYTGAAKIIVDGSPQGFTAYLSKPFYAMPETASAGKDVSYRGKPLYTKPELVEKIVTLNAAGWQLALHGNGDGAIDLILDSLQEAGLRAEDNHRSILVHAQTVREDQITRMQSLGVTPSFFVAHVFYWGEWHRAKVLGEEWAENISPAGWALQQGVKFSLHSDAPVTPMRPFELAAYAMQRATQAGRILGPEHRLGVLQALRALTLDAAWQAFLDDRMGSLESGKFADLVVVSESPLNVPAEVVAKIEVVETVVGGRSVYRKTSVTKTRNRK